VVLVTNMMVALGGLENKHEAGIISRGAHGEAEGGILVQPVDNALDPRLQVGFIEVGQETDPAVGEPQVGLQLLLEYGSLPRRPTRKVPGRSAP
jgi:hypothetical protein